MTTVEESEFKHGLTGYTKHKCRCAVCKAEKSATDAAYYRKRKIGRIKVRMQFPKCDWTEPINVPIRTLDNPYGEAGQVYLGSMTDDVYAGGTAARSNTGFRGTRIA